MSDIGPLSVILFMAMVVGVTAAVTVYLKPETCVVEQLGHRERVVMSKSWDGDVEYRLEIWGCGDGGCWYLDAGEYRGANECSACLPSKTR